MASLSRVTCCCLVALAAAGSPGVSLQPRHERVFAGAREGLTSSARWLQLQLDILQLRVQACGRRIDCLLSASMAPRPADGVLQGWDEASAYATVEQSTSADSSWELKLTSGSVRVWRRSVPGSKVNEVRANGIIDASPKAVVSLLCDGDAHAIRSYNPLYAEGFDVCRIDHRTRLSYASVKAFFPLKPRDTLTRVAIWELPRLGSGATALLLQHAEHPDVPVYSEYVRAKILRGMHLIQPVEGCPGKSNFTLCTQVDAGGIIPSFVMNIITTQDSLQFMDRLEKAAAQRE
ncbi:hypothetical protein AB1Y20_003907 [Prymnesium parvum]|uniref:START domain-containing protein n=1 Tax=Prymnesium parvum TaxID=97485 RepID=A0AB34J5Y5_PRYPA